MSDPSSAPEPDGARQEITQHLIDELGAFMRRMRTSGLRVAQAHGLHLTQTQLLVALTRLGECRVATLAETQLVDPSVASRQVASLERLGLVMRRADPEDARAALVSLTEAGRAALAEVRSLHVEVVTDALSDWPVERLTRFASDLEDFLSITGPVYDALGPRSAGRGTGDPSGAPPSRGRSEPPGQGRRS